MPKPFFITTAIDYTNGAPHIGHAYEKVLADVLARYHRLKGDDTFLLTGVDQHGQKVQQSAEKAGLEPQAYVDGITEKFTALWEKLGVEYTGWAATTDAKHKECVRANLQMLWDDKVPGSEVSNPETGGRSRWIYKKTQRGFYSVRQEQFLTDKERGPDGEFGPEWQPVEEREEENFYFRLTYHEDLGFDPKQWLLDFIDRRSAQGKPFVVPDFRVAELRNAVEKLEGDLCISRPASRLKWGIPFPESFGAGFVTYVWFDALVNYITYAPCHDPHYGERNQSPATSHQSPAFSDWWPPLHVIGKDILIPAHGVYWPIMLKALGFTDEEMPTLLVHGWWNIAGAKMSKSLGNIVDPDLLADKYGPEALRYYLMSDIATGKDSDFSEERLVGAYNAALANSLGNLLNRALNMAAKYQGGIVSNVRLNPVNLTGTGQQGDGPVFGVAASIGGDSFDGPDGKHVNLAAMRFDLETGVKSFEKMFEERHVNLALFGASEIARVCNELVEKSAPWKLAKLNDKLSCDRLGAVLYTLAESLRIIAIMISPVLPKAAHGIFDQLNWKLDEAGKESRFRLADAVWGGLPDGHILGKPVPLFPRIEAPKAE